MQNQTGKVEKRKIYLVWLQKYSETGFATSLLIAI